MMSPVMNRMKYSYLGDTLVTIKTGTYSWQSFVYEIMYEIMVWDKVSKGRHISSLLNSSHYHVTIQI